MRRPPAGSGSRSAPATVAVPAVGLSSVVSMRSVVVLPAPFGPRKPTISPSSTVRSTPRTASTRPLRLENVRARPQASMIAMPVSFRSLPAVRARVAGPGLGLVRRQLRQELRELVMPANLGVRLHHGPVHHRGLDRPDVSLGQEPPPLLVHHARRAHHPPPPRLRHARRLLPVLPGSPNGQRHP